VTTTRKLEIISKLLDPHQMRAVEVVVTRIVANSFHQDAARGGLQGRIKGELRATEAEIRRRASICWDWFTAMRAECGFSTQHALDLLPAALRAELDGVPWIPPPPERSWSPVTGD
jgi:hypothetical protein